MSFSKHFTTILGILAILFWSTNIAFSRTVFETMGTLTAASSIYLLSGFLGLIQITISGHLRNVIKLSFHYWLLCGGFFIVNMIGFYLAIGFASGRQQVLEVTLINYLWPSFTLLFSILILKKKTRFFILIPGMLMASLGIFLGTMKESFSLATFWQNCQTNSFPYLMAFVAAFSWGLYSSFSRRFANELSGGVTPIFMIISGAILFVLRCFSNENTVLTTRALMELAYVSFFSTFLACTFWDIAMRKGNVVLVASISYFTPLISVLASSIHFSVRPGIGLWIGCVMVIAGAFICKVSIVEESDNVTKS